MLSHLIKLAGDMIRASTLVARYDEALAAYKAGEYHTAAPVMLDCAEAGYAPAAALYGSMLILGQGVPENGREAVRWLEIAVEQGYEAAKPNLAMALATGKAGAPRDMERAIPMLEECAAGGCEQSGRMLRMIQNREGIFRGVNVKGKTKRK